MDLGLTGKTALVLAGGGGLGSAIARTLAHEGARVAVVDIDGKAAGATAAAIRGEGGEALDMAWDLGDPGVAPTNIRKIEAEFGQVDILVNITGGPSRASNSG